MGDNVTSSPTIDQVRSAASFGPALCSPVATLIRGVGDKLPADRVFFIGIELAAGNAYLPPKSKLADYYYRSLVQFKELLKNAGLRQDFFAKEYDPAIAFFKTQMARGNAIRIACANDPFSASPPHHAELPAPNNGSARALADVLTKTFSYTLNGSAESWLDHRLFSIDIKKSKDLIIVIGEDHANAPDSYSQMRLLDRLLQRRKNVAVRVALEDSPEELRDSFTTFQGFPERSRMKSMRTAGAGAEQLYHWIVGDQRKIDAYYENIKGEVPDLTIEKFNALFHTNSRSKAMYVMMEEAFQDLWALEDLEKRREMQALIYGKRKANPTAEERLSEAIKRHRASKLRSAAMAENLMKKMRDDQPGKPRIIILTTGAFHALSVISDLRKKSPASVIGLMPHHLMDDLMKAPSAAR